MKVLHIGAECYPAAKAGGLGDVAGALPKYLSENGCPAAVIIPKYHTKWIVNQTWKTCLEGQFPLGYEPIRFSIQELQGRNLGFPLYVVDIPGKFDRTSIYLDIQTGKGYADELERNLSFQQAVLHWIKQLDKLPTVIHCHDQHTGLIPFMIKYCPVFKRLASIPTIFTIHNAAYHGAFGWEQVHKLPLYDGRQGGLIDWDKAINPLAAAIKNCWRLTTVSPSYMLELQETAGNLAPLLVHENAKSIGILNGIDIQVWNPKTDIFLNSNLKRSIKTFKKKNKEGLRDKFPIQSDLPLITFIGRLAGEKGADLLAPMIDRFFYKGGQASFIILGTGDPQLHTTLKHLASRYRRNVHVALEYNEGLAHQLYAGSDFLVMPSKVEPCGLNQMYAMRYGTVPIVRGVGGLKDTVIDLNEDGGRGIQFKDLTPEDASYALIRAVDAYSNQAQFEAVRNRIMTIDFSWQNAANQYIDLYDSVAH